MAFASQTGKRIAKKGTLALERLPSRNATGRVAGVRPPDSQAELHPASPNDNKGMRDLSGFAKSGLRDRRLGDNSIP